MNMEKKKIFMWVNFYKDRREIGISKKIKSEIQTLKNIGYEVYYTSYLESGVAICNDNDEVIMQRIYVKPTTNTNGFVLSQQLIKIAITYLEENKFDFALLRINRFTKKYMKMLNVLKNNNTFVMMESLSYFPELKYSDLSSFGYKFFWHEIKKKKKCLKNYVDLMLTEGKISDFWGIPAIEFSMGVDADSMPEHNYIGRADEINMIMVGCSSIYHGTDRIINSMADYYNSSSHAATVKLHLVGDVLEQDVKRIDKLNLQRYVYCYGKKYGDELYEIYNKCNIALGPLAQYRVKKKDTGLKTKEYLAIGIPYVYTGIESRLPKNYKYILEISNDSSIVDINKIIRFYTSVKEDDNMVGVMRADAKKYYSWEDIFIRIFQYISKLNEGKCK